MKCSFTIDASVLETFSLVFDLFIVKMQKTHTMMCFLHHYELDFTRINKRKIRLSSGYGKKKYVKILAL